MRVLFSPVGTTDPVRNCRDGACLHILRHYQPDHVVLYYTAEMEEREKQTQMYTLGIEHVQPGCPVTEFVLESRMPICSIPIFIICHRLYFMYIRCILMQKSCLT